MGRAHYLDRGSPPGRKNFISQMTLTETILCSAGIHGSRKKVAKENGGSWTKCLERRNNHYVKRQTVNDHSRGTHRDSKKDNKGNDSFGGGGNLNVNSRTLGEKTYQFYR